jgi:hypothetical protein
MKLKTLTTLFLSLVFCSVITGSEYFNITDIGTSAETIGAGHIEGAYQKPYAVFENPAMLSDKDKMAFSVFQTTFDNDLNYKNISASYSSKYGTLGVGVMNASVDDLIASTKSDSGFFEEDYNFSYTNSLSKLSYKYSDVGSLVSLPLPVNVGMSVSYFSTKVDTYSASGTDLDIGASFERNNMSFSGVLQNALGSKIEYKNNSNTSYSGEETLARKVVVSTKIKLRRLHVKSHLKRYKGKYLSSWGLSYTPPWVNIIDFSVGKRSYLNFDEVVRSGTFGMSIVFESIGFHYALEKSDSVLIDYKHYFSLDMNFKKK